MTTSFFNPWKVLDRVLTADRTRTPVDTAAYDRLQDHSLDTLQQQVDELRERIEAIERRWAS